MDKVLVAKDVVYASSTAGGVVGAAHVDSDLLVNGALVVYTEDGRLLTAANAATVLAAAPNTKKFYILLGGVPLQGGKNSGMIDRATLDITVKSAVTAVKHVVQVGQDGAGGALNLPASVVAGDILGVRISDNSEGTIPAKRKSYYEVVVKPSETGGAALIRLVAKINADGNRFVNAAILNVNTGMSLTAIDDNIYLEVGVDGIIADATIFSDGTNSSTALVYSSGDYAQILAAESDSDIEDGDTNRLWLHDSYFSRAKGATSGAAYLIYTLSWKELGMTDTQSGWRPQTCTVAIPNAGATVPIATFNTILAALAVVESIETGIN